MALEPSATHALDHAEAPAGAADLGDDLPDHAPRLDEPRSPLWLSVMGLLLAATAIVWWLSTPSDREQAAADAAASASAAASSASALAAAQPSAAPQPEEAAPAPPPPAPPPTPAPSGTFKIAPNLNNPRLRGRQP